MNKKYHIGYIAGVFDLFHIGHLNLIRNAKEMCDYLIVGVLSDNLVIHFKKIPPFIPETERLQIVDALEAVNQTVIVDNSNIDKVDAWNLYHFDCLFSGDDWKNNSSWIEDKVRLNELGSDIYFFSYTTGTSSSKIKKILGDVDLQDRKIFIYGAGKNGKRAYDYYGSKAVAFLDRDIEKQGTLVNGLPCIPPEKILKELDEGSTIIISVKCDREQIKEELEKQTQAKIKYFT